MEISTIIVINGFPGAGKDTFVEYLTDVVKETNKNILIENISSIDIVKQYAKLLGWNGEKTPLMRDMLAEYKVFLEKYFNIPSKSLYDRVNNLIGMYDESIHDKIEGMIIFVHIREPENIREFVSEYPKCQVKTLLIDTDNEPSEEIHNKSDLDVREYEYDYVIKNNYDRNTFKESARTFLNIILGEEDNAEEEI